MRDYQQQPETIEERLEAAFREGYRDGYCDAGAGALPRTKDDVDESWDNSETKAALLALVKDL